jgi:ABC-type glycerol-3-phosphate transport system permease component
MTRLNRLARLLQRTLVYVALFVSAMAMLFPFLVMLFTSFKVVQDTFRYPPTLLPREQELVTLEGYDEPLPVFQVEVDGQNRAYALIEENVPAGRFVDPNDPVAEGGELVLPLEQVSPTGTSVMLGGEEVPLVTAQVDGQTVTLAQVGRTVLGRFADPSNPDEVVFQNVRTSRPVERLSYTLENYDEVIGLHRMARSLTNTVLVTVLVVLGQLATSVLGGYAFARLKFPGRDGIFLVYLGTIMIPFVVLIIPLYQLMVMIGWVDRLASLIIPWVFTAYGTFLMRQFFIQFPKEIEEAAVIDGASRLAILMRIFLPASTPALATLTTFSFLYAWNSFFWPLVVINTGNTDNQVLTLALSILGGRAADRPNLVLAGAAIAILPPMLIYIFAQRFFVESQTSAGVKG